MVGVIKVATLIHAVILGAPGASALPEGEAGFATEEAPAQSTAPVSPPPAAASPPQTLTIVARPAPAAPVQEPVKKLPPRRILSLTFSPLHLLFPIVELEAELAMAPHFGVGVIGGAGSMNIQTVDPNYPDQDFSVYELGGQVIGYPLREFSSLQLGAEVMWVHVSTTTYQGQSVHANAGGVAFGPFVGYKVLTDVGFTFVAQGGFQYAAVKASASDSDGNSARAETSDFVPLLNLNLGWSF